MRSSSQLVCAWAPLMMTAFVWSCAEGSAEDATSLSAATLPDIDASSPQRLPSSSDAGKQDAPANGNDNIDSGGTDDEAPVEEPPPPSSPPASPPVTKPAQGEVLITEVMYDSTGAEPSTEWIEVHNTSSAKRSLSGLTIVDGGDRKQVIGSGVTIDAGAYLVLVRNKSAAIAAKVPSASIGYEYGTGVADSSGIQLANAATGAVYLKDGSTTIAQATYGGWFTQSGGGSIQLKTMTYSSGAQSSSWCLSKNAWSTGSDKGTPGSASDCP